MQREPLDYENPQTELGVTLTPMPTLIAYGLVYIVVGGAMIVAVPNLEQLYKDFKIQLPTMTVWMLHFSRWFRGIGWLLLLPIPVVVPLCLARIHHKEAPPTQARNWRIAGITSIVILLFAVLFFVSLWLPVLTLMRSVSSPTK